MCHEMIEQKTRPPPFGCGDDVSTSIKGGRDIHLKPTIGSVILESLVPHKWIEEPQNCRRSPC